MPFCLLFPSISLQFWGIFLSSCMSMSYSRDVVLGHLGLGAKIKPKTGSHLTVAFLEVWMLLLPMLLLLLGPLCPHRKQTDCQTVPQSTGCGQSTGCSQGGAIHCFSSPLTRASFHAVVSREQSAGQRSRQSLLTSLWAWDHTGEARVTFSLLACFWCAPD